MYNFGYSPIRDIKTSSKLAYRLAIPYVPRLRDRRHSTLSCSQVTSLMFLSGDTVPGVTLIVILLLICFSVVTYNAICTHR